MSQQTNTLQEEATSSIFSTKLLMISSAVFLAVLGLVASFFPENVLAAYNLETTFMGILMVKVMGALYLGFAVLNWMGKGNLIGGIYSRPVAMGNFVHFVFIAITLLKLLITNQATILIITGATLYTLFAICFGYILFSGGKSCS
ncbi:MAG: hypothetical protein U5J95_09180 [Balneolaceae bacterium]|nr:hypothetical protein [Balneolaceae bacterium]